MHYTSDKGDLGVAIVTADLIKRGFDVMLPLSATLPFDLVIHKDSKFYRIQVKYRKILNGGINVSVTRAVITNNKISRQRIGINDIDILAIYCPDTDKIYYVYYKDISWVTTLKLRIIPPKNNQQYSVRLASNYTNLDFLK